MRIVSVVSSVCVHTCSLMHVLSCKCLQCSLQWMPWNWVRLNLMRRQMCAPIRAAIREHMAAAKAHLAGDTSVTQRDRPDMLDIALRACYADGMHVTEGEVVDQTTSFLFAGHGKS